MDKIKEKAYELFPFDDDNLIDDINHSKRTIYCMGAEEVVERIHTALKRLQLDKHSIALNVLRVAEIELPKK